MHVQAQDIPADKIIATTDLSTYLNTEAKKNLGEDITEAKLAGYFREKFQQRYFYNWKNLSSKFEEYNSVYPEIKAHHLQRAEDHLSKYTSATTWKLPFNYLNGQPVDAYALRHLARQHKMVDIALLYNYSNQDSQYLEYFTSQMNSLNNALEAGNYETIEDGNGVYEAFRSGYRVLNWLQIHNMFLGEKEYSDKDQLTTIATLLQHGQHLYENNQEFNPGNHQTRGMSALAMLSILFRDFEGTQEWYAHSMRLLQEHLSAEINADGFQSERTVHYHMSDIKNYFYVYQLARNTQLEVDSVWEEKLKFLFTTLAKIAYPDGSAPVFSDDTDAPWAEKNDISGAMTLGYLLFDEPQLGFFATNKVDPDMFWYLSKEQLLRLETIEKQDPEFGSLEFPDTGYYIMREGWEKGDMMMAISAGVDDEKPDHQHGDVLGIQAMANGKVLLPNYQVRYYLEDLELFKNSLVKNVALVDDELQGKDYRSNKGGSGFGKFGKLPKPQTQVFKTLKELDLFVGTHDGFKNVGVDYARKVIFVKNDFWIVVDEFASETSHDYKQIWQGHYTLEIKTGLLRSTFEDGSGLDIFQLKNIDGIESSGARGKQWSVVNKEAAQNHRFLTILQPFRVFDARIDEDSDSPVIAGWDLNDPRWKIAGEEATAVTKYTKGFFFSTEGITLDTLELIFESPSDIYIEMKKGQLHLQSLEGKSINVQITKDSKLLKKLKIAPGENTVIN
ncbi:heparinase II/III family protein [Christiangramia portivictoriae]|uniref:heparinase II/III family protein n=1 Tax=Christiangramia portivictoriae TaxID=326069 RepID=UPI00040B00C3|nr:heparinase II/III family protein [Christiangramia portivictoriae]